MSEPGSVTVWLDRLKAGEDRDEAVARLWERYFSALVKRASEHLRGRGAADGEDAALSAFDGFVRGVEAGKFPSLNHRDDLWRVLFVITTRKAINLVRDENRKKRGGGHAAHLLANPATDSAPDVFAQLASAEPEPDFVAGVTEECGRLLGLLGEGEFRDVAVWKMEGYTNAEIAAKLNRSVPTVERKLAAIRSIWERAADR